MLFSQVFNKKFRLSGLCCGAFLVLPGHMWPLIKNAQFFIVVDMTEIRRFFIMSFKSFNKLKSVFNYGGLND